MHKAVATKLVKRLSPTQQSAMLERLKVMEATACFLDRSYDRRLLQHVRVRLQEQLQEGSNDEQYRVA